MIRRIRSACGESMLRWTSGRYTYGNGRPLKFKPVEEFEVQIISTSTTATRWRTIVPVHRPDCRAALRLDRRNRRRSE